MRLLGFGTLCVCVFLCAFTARAEDLVSAAMSDALAATLVGDTTRVASIREMVARDYPAKSDSATGLLDDLAALEIVSASTSRKEKGEALKKLSGKMNDPVARERMKHLAHSVPEVQLEELIHKRKVNRVTGVVNRTWQTTAEVLAGQPRALAVAGTDAFYAVTGRTDPSVVDKKIGYLASLRENQPEASPEEIAEAQQMVSELEDKKSESLKRYWKQSIEDAENAGEFPRAERLCRIGSGLWPEEAAAFGELSAEVARKQTKAEQAAVVTTPPTTENHATAMLLRKKILEGGSTPPPISVAQATTSIGEAQAERRSKTFNYIVFGQTNFGVNSHGVARSVAQHGSDAPAALGLIQGAQTVMRGVSLLFGNTLGVEKAIEAYGEVERTNPAALTDDDYRDWADLYAKTDRYPEAIQVLESHSISDDKRIKKYREGWGSEIVKRADELPAGEDRFKALKFVIEDLSDTKAAARAEKVLAETPSSERPLVQVPKEDLVTYAPILQEAGFSLSPEWWDGDKSNGEMSDEGVYWDPQGSVWYRVGKRSPWRKIDQPEESRTRLQGYFDRIEQEGIARALREGRRGQRSFPLEVEGALGPDGSYLTPKFVQYDLTEDREGLFQ